MLEGVVIRNTFQLSSPIRSNSGPVQSIDFTRHSWRFTSQNKDMIMKKISLFTFELKQLISLEWYPRLKNSVYWKIQEVLCFACTRDLFVISPEQHIL